MINKEIPIKSITIAENHRNKVEDDSIAELMQSIKQNGLKQPIGVCKNKTGGGYTLLFGNRRLIACTKLGYANISAQIEEHVDIKQLMILNVTENLQRKDPSWAEFGRVIEKLQKMGLTTKEISVRIGVEERKILELLATFKQLPERFRGKVKFIGKGGNRKEGDIAPQVATALIRLKKSHGLTDKNLDELVSYAGKGDVSREALKNINVMLKTGIKFEDAIEKSYDYEVYRIDFVCHRLKVSQLVEETGAVTVQRLFKMLLYGLKPGVKVEKPDFIKF